MEKSDVVWARGPIVLGARRHPRVNVVAEVVQREEPAHVLHLNAHRILDAGGERYVEVGLSEARTDVDEYCPRDKRTSD